MSPHVPFFSKFDTNSRKKLTILNIVISICPLKIKLKFDLHNEKKKTNLDVNSTLLCIC